MLTRNPDSYSFCDDEAENKHRIGVLRSSGVNVSSPERVYVGSEVQLELIEPEAVLVQGIIRGKHTVIGTGAYIGTSGTAVLQDAQVGRSVELGAGSYRGATLLDGVKVRGFAELRPGTVLEEQAELGHNVGLKNTLFTVGAVAGSAINFCDVLVTGGTSRQDHTEIGSGCVHFNFDPRGDKFGSLLGGSEGLLLRSRRIFVGGNSGLVAPVHVGFGAVIAAGSTVRANIPDNCFYSGQDAIRFAPGYNPDLYGDLSRKFLVTAALCGHLQAIVAWYEHVRMPFADPFERLIYNAAIHNLRSHLRHRASEAMTVIGKLRKSISSGGLSRPFGGQHSKIVAAETQINAALTSFGEFPQAPAEFLRKYGRQREGMSHIQTIRNLENSHADAAGAWLQAIAAKSPASIARIMI